MKKNIIYIIGFTLILTSCSIHKIDIQQGNVLELDKVAQLEPGMTTKQVRFLLGNPAIQDPFHHNRWDYVYLFQSGRKGSAAEHQHLVLYFEDDKLVKIEKRDLNPVSNPDSSGPDSSGEENPMRPDNDMDAD